MSSPDELQEVQITARRIDNNPSGARSSDSGRILLAATDSALSGLLAAQAVTPDVSTGMEPQLIDPPLPQVPMPRLELTSKEVKNLMQLGVSEDQIAAIEGSLFDQSQNGTISPSNSLTKSDRNSVLRLISANDEAFEGLKSLNARLRNAVIDTDANVVSVSSEISSAQISADGTTLTGFSFDEREYQFAVHLRLWERVQGSNAPTTALKTNAQTAATAQNVNQLPPASTADIQASQTLRQFMYTAADPTDNAALGGTSQHFEKIFRVEGSAAAGYAITAIRAGGTLGSHILDLVTPNTAAVFHDHYGGNQVIQIPYGGDHSPVKFKDIPSFMYAGEDNRLYEVYRVNQGAPPQPAYFYGRVTRSGTLTNTRQFDGK